MKTCCRRSDSDTQSQRITGTAAFDKVNPLASALGAVVPLRYCANTIRQDDGFVFDRDAGTFDISGY
jgi:hypothetical protein